MKCPRCGYETPKPPTPPYEYTGHVKAYLPAILAGLRSGENPQSIASAVNAYAKKDVGPSFYWQSVSAGMIRYIGVRYKILEPKKLEAITPARQEHAWLLRAEGLTFREIGNRLGVTGQQARLLVFRFGEKASRATRRVRWSIHSECGANQ